MAILKIRDANGNVQEILAIKGDKGDKGADGTMTFEDLTPEQKESLKGDKGDAYVLTNADKQEIAEKALPSVTTADNGKFMRVVGGAWGAVSVTNAEEVAY